MKQQKRDSNMELYRIVCMLTVVFFHIFGLIILHFFIVYIINIIFVVYIIIIINALRI